ncbi:MAG: type IX secretion system sortase PorU, partial [Bacteroidota bacterium]
LKFVNDAQQLREYVCFSTIFLTPKSEGKVANQNLHAATEKDYLIITHPNFLVQAQRLAQHHTQKNNLRTLVVTTEQVYNEFASGSPDPTSIRDFAKMYFDRYKTTWGNTGKYLLLFGKSSFDYKNRVLNNTMFVPGYESVASLDPLSTYTSDDFFGFLEDAEDINSGVVVNTLDVGIGRVPAKNNEEAKNFVDKVIGYHEANSLGPWRTNLNFIADDEDQNLHLQDAEVLTAISGATSPVFNNQKIYLDAFQQEGGSAGGRYPAANAVINNNIFNGTLFWNYSGHGGPQRLAEEVVIDQSIVNNWNNVNRLPLFITATCDFAPYDNPSANSLGENLLVRPKTGAIALMTTTRVVFAFSNRIMNDNYLRTALQPDAQGRYKTLGEAVRDAKNYTYQTSGDITNNRKFALLGDPALTLGFPTFKVMATTVNGKNILAIADTLRATDEAIIEGEVQQNGGALLSNFSGTVFLSLYDKPRTVTTLANDAGSQPVAFSDASSILFRGKASAINGKFRLNFKLPKDINYQYGSGKISLYAHDGVKEGAGFSSNIIIGSIGNTATTDVNGPAIKAFLNDEKFVNGSITNANPILLLHLTDSSGINTGSAGIDHDIVATLDNDNNQYFVLSNFYESDLDDFTKGKISFQLPQLKPGRHSLKIKVWDAVNNSSEYMMDFTVVESAHLQIDHVL